MRTLTGTLTTAQQASAVVPYVKVVATYGETTYTFDNVGTGGASKRVIGVESLEEPFGGRATILLDNSDAYFLSKNLKGYNITLSWGASADGYESSAQAPLFVLNQKDMSQEGILVTELQCLDLWWKMAYTMVVRAGYRLTGDITEGLVLGELITGSNSGATGRLVEITANTVTLTSVSGDFALADNAEGAVGACNIVSAIDSVTGGSGTDYGRNETILTIMNAIVPAAMDAVLDSDDPDDTINTYQPLLVTPIGTNVRLLIRQLLQMSKCNARIENDSDLHILYPDSEAAADYTYETDHVFWYQMRERAVILPNAVLFVNHMPGSVPDAETQFSGTAQDDYSVDRLGELADIQVNPTIQSDAEATTLATAWITQRLAEAYQGSVRAPMNCNQELYDQVTIVDSRSGVTITGRVGRIVRRYAVPGVVKGFPHTIETFAYEIEVTLGGVVSNPGDVGGPGTLDIDLSQLGSRLPKEKTPPYYPDWSTILPKAVQGYRHDLVFSETDYNTVAWTSGTITFYDGTTQAVSAGNTGDMGSDDIRYIYFDLDDAVPATLKVVTDYVANFNTLTGLLCMVQRGSTSDIAPTIIPSYGKEPLISCDIIDMTGLKTYDYGSGATLQAILSTQIQAGSIKISAVTVFDTDYDPTDKFDLGDDSLDDIDDGTTYERLRATDISAGHIKLTDSVVVDDEWYNESGVEIDSRHGINIYGEDAAFTTRATKTGTIQCKVGSDGSIVAGAGAVKLNSDGIRIDGNEGLNMFTMMWGATNVGSIWSSSATRMEIFSNKDLYIGAHGSYRIYFSSEPLPYADSTINFGSAAKAWKDIYTDSIYIGTTQLNKTTLDALIALLP